MGSIFSSDAQEEQQQEETVSSHERRTSRVHFAHPEAHPECISLMSVGPTVEQQQQQQSSNGSDSGSDCHSPQQRQTCVQQRVPNPVARRRSAPTFGRYGSNASYGSSIFETQTQDFKDDDAIVAAAPAVTTQPEPDPSTSVDGPLSLATRIEYSALPRGETRDVFGLVTVHAAAADPEPQGPADAEAERQPMDITCVLDVSGSMTGQKIDQVRGALRFIISQAEAKDRVSIVTFNSSAHRVLKMSKMDEAGKDAANVAALRLTAGGGTSIAAGLDVGLQVMEQRRQRNKVSAILLLTDGQDHSSAHRIPQLIQRAAAAHCALYAFGFGSDHDAALLSQIAEQAQTPFTYVEDTEKIAAAFAGAVGGLASIVAQSVCLSLKSFVPIKAVNTGFPVNRLSDTHVTISIPDMFAGERRDVLVELAVPATSDAVGVGPLVLLDATACYTDLRSNSQVQTEAASMAAQRVEEPQPELEPDLEVSAQRERVEVTRALEEAAAQSEQGRFNDAQEVLDSAARKMRASKYTTPVREALDLELRDARRRMQSRSEWESGGRAEVKDAAQMHKMQRATTCFESSRSSGKRSKSMYVSAAQSGWISKSSF